MTRWRPATEANFIIDDWARCVKHLAFFREIEFWRKRRIPAKLLIMRAKLVVAVLAAALVILGLAFFLSRSSGTKSPEVVTEPANAPGVEAPTPPEQFAPREARVVSANPVPMIPAVATNTAGTNEPAMTPERAAYLRAQSDLLFKLGMRSDPESYQTIVSTLTNSEKTLRSEALDAAIQFGNRDVIPYLKELAARTEDPYEKIAFLEAAEYIALPSLTELRQQQKLQQASQPNQIPQEPRAPRTNRFRNFRPGASVPPAPPPQP